MATISTLAVNLVARTSAFEKGMKRGRKATKSFKTSVTSASASLGKLAAGLGLAVGIRGMQTMVKNTLAAIDAIAKMGKELQISTEALVGFEHAAKINGSTIQDVQKGIQIMVRRLGEAKNGYGEGKRGLDAIGESAQNLIDMGTEKAFMRIADAVKQSTTAADKANIAYQFFGRSGVNLINLLNEGSSGLRVMRNEVDALGVSFNEVDAAKVEEANDSIVRMKAAFAGLGNLITIKLAGPLEVSANILKKMITDARDLKRELTGIEKNIAKQQTAEEFAAQFLSLKELQKALEDRLVIQKKLAKSRSDARSMERLLLVSVAQLHAKQQIKALNERIDLIKKQTKAQQELNRVNAIRDNIIKNFNQEGADIKRLMDEALDKENKVGFDRPSSKFQQIRSEFIDVAALNPATTPTTELRQLNKKTDKTNFLLEELNRNSLGVHQT